MLALVWWGLYVQGVLQANLISRQNSPPVKYPFKALTTQF